MEIQAETISRVLGWVRKSVDALSSVQVSGMDDTSAREVLAAFSRNVIRPALELADEGGYLGLDIMEAGARLQNGPLFKYPDGATPVCFMGVGEGDELEYIRFNQEAIIATANAITMQLNRNVDRYGERSEFLHAQTIARMVGMLFRSDVPISVNAGWL